MTARLYSEMSSELPQRLLLDEEPCLSPPRKERRIVMVSPSNSMRLSSEETLYDFGSMNSLDTFVSIDTTRKTQRTGRWCASEDQKLRTTLARFDVKKKEELNWVLIAKLALDNSRSPEQCRLRWEKVISLGLIKGPWSPEEDEIVRKAVEASKIASNNECNWSLIAAQLPGRLTKQVRERWQNHLNPELIKTPWTLEEDLLLVSLQAVLGNRWNEIARAFHGRSENAIKNRWNSKQRQALQLNQQKNVSKENATDQASNPPTRRSIVANVCSMADKFRDVCRNVNFHKALLKASGSDPEISEAAQILITKVNRSGIITVVQQ